jgi:hypothetical protein
MQGLFDQKSEEELGEIKTNAERSGGALWLTATLGFAGSATICWIVLKLLTPFIATNIRFIWLERTWAKAAICVVVAAPFAVLLTRIEGTIWGKYYVIVGYLLCAGLIVWIALRLLHII